MKTTIRSNRLTAAKYEIAALLCMAFVLTGCKKEAVPSAGKALVRTTVVESMENVRSDSEASYRAQVRAGKETDLRFKVEGIIALMRLAAGTDWDEGTPVEADNLTTDITDNVPLDLTAPLVARPYPNDLSPALTVAIENRTEIAALEKEEHSLVEGIITAKAGSVLTARTENIKKAVRALELATDHYKAGTGTQIDVLNAQTALTETLGPYVDALRDYSVALATLIRATGADLQN